MQRRSLIAAGLALLASAALLPTDSFAQQVRLRYAHVGAEGDIQYWFAEEAAKSIPQVTEGRVTVQVFPNSQLGGVQEMIDGVKSGSISMGHHEFASLDRLAKDIAVFNAPFVYRDGAHALAATDPRNSEILQEFNTKLIAEGGMRIVGRLFRGARQMTAKQAIYSPADLQGKRFRGVPIQLWTTMIRGFGAVPTPVEVSELPTALMTGMVIGQENPLTMINANKLYEVQTHVMLTGHMQNVLPVFINERVWQSISEKDRNAILDGLDRIAQDTLRQAQKAEQDLIGELQKKGMTFVTEKEGLKLSDFRERVSAEVNKDFPTWKAYMDRIAAVK
jgi:tripartite ATP-independent transporter DctP family solute receptor